MKRILIGFIAGVMFCYATAQYLPSDAFNRGDSYARGDYAGIVNDCYDRNRDNTVDAMYSCIASHD